LKDHNIPTDTTVQQEGETATVVGFASNPPDAADAGNNFLTPAIHQLVLRDLIFAARFGPAQGVNLVVTHYGKRGAGICFAI
jgi:hypothetical protein